MTILTLGRETHSNVVGRGEVVISVAVVALVRRVRDQAARVALLTREGGMGPVEHEEVAVPELGRAPAVWVVAVFTANNPTVGDVARSRQACFLLMAQVAIDRCSGIDSS